MNTGSKIYQKKRITVSKKGLFSIDCSPCGKFIVCSCRDQLIRKFDLVSYKLIHKNRSDQRHGINQIRFSPDGQLIASGSNDDSIIIRDAATFQKIGKTLLGHEGWVNSVAFSPDSLHLASASLDGTIRIWDCQSQEQIGENIEVVAEVHSVEYSPNGLYILSGHWHGIDIWDSTTRHCLLNLKSQQITLAVYSLDGRYILSRDSFDLLQLWDATNGNQIGRYRLGQLGSIRSIAFSPDSSLIASGICDKTVRLCFATGEQESILYSHDGKVNTVQFSKDGKQVLSGSDDGTIFKVKIKI